MGEAVKIEVELLGDPKEPEFNYVKSHNGRVYRRINLRRIITEDNYKKLRGLRNTQEEIALKIGLDQRTLSKLIKREGWCDGEKFRPPHKHTVNEGFFKKWTRESAWVFGWLLTDGSVLENGQISLNLHPKDKDVLFKIKEKIGFSGDVSDVGKGTKAYSQLRICRKGMAEDLFSLGMARKDKTFNTRMPNIPEHLFWDFFRGVFEGDGSIRHRTGNTDDLEITICGATKQFMEDLRENLEKRHVHVRINERAVGKSGNKAPLYYITTKSNADALRLGHFMYLGTNNHMRLERKFSVFAQYVKTYHDTVNRRSKTCIQIVNEIQKNISECSNQRAS